MHDIVVEYYDDVYFKVICERSIAYTLTEEFMFDVPSAKFHPQFKFGLWDGKIRLFNINTNQMYVGLLDKLVNYATTHKYSIKVDSKFSKREFSMVEGETFIRSLNIPEKIELRPYQIKSFVRMVRDRRLLLVSPTGSGKSLIIYFLARYLNATRTLIIVPTVSLVHQLYSDFEDYGFDSAKHIHRIYAEQDSNTDRPIVITTWQSIYDNPKKWFAQFNVVIGDEAHLYKAKSLTGIMGKLVNCPNKYGVTGSLDDTLTNKLVLEGLFGSAVQYMTTSELIEQKYLSPFKIKCIVLQYADSYRAQVKKYDYKEEMKFVVTNNDRNRFIRNLVLGLKGNTLVLFQYVDKHGVILYNDIVNRTSTPVHFIHGGVKGVKREEIRKEIISNSGQQNIIIASYGTFSTGVNIPNIDNLIFASPSKSKIRNVQSIGRVLRKAEGKDYATLYDISDDLQYKSVTNYGLDHFKERVRLYNEQKFEYKLYHVQLNEDKGLF